jgi:hypothetical protein
MLYPWPLDVDANLLSEALEIAMDYLERTGQAYPFSAVQQLCAFTINNAWRDGRRHKLRLANDAIRAVEKKENTMKITTIALATSMALASTFALAQGGGGGPGGGGPGTTPERAGGSEGSRSRPSRVRA